MTREQRSLWGIDMLNVPRSDIPAVTHVDYSARVQTVSADTAPNYHALIKEFERQTGCGVVVNTSFNVRGEPIVCTPADAYQCFMRTHIDYLVLGPFLLDKVQQPAWEETSEWQREFQLD
jgi:carbamoyltransferase